MRHIEPRIAWLSTHMRSRCRIRREPLLCSFEHLPNRLRFRARSSHGPTIKHAVNNEVTKKSRVPQISAVRIIRSAARRSRFVCLCFKSERFVPAGPIGPKPKGDGDMDRMGNRRQLNHHFIALPSNLGSPGHRLSGTPSDSIRPHSKERRIPQCFCESSIG